MGVRPGESPGELRPDDRARLEKSWQAHMRTIWQRLNLGMTNFDSNYRGALAEQSPKTATAQKLFYQAQLARRFEGAPERALELYEQAWPYWIDVLLENPEDARSQITQEDGYEFQLRHLRLEHIQRANVFCGVMTFAAQLGGPVHPPYDQLLS